MARREVERRTRGAETRQVAAVIKRGGEHTCNRYRTGSECHINPMREKTQKVYGCRQAGMCRLHQHGEVAGMLLRATAHAAYSTHREGKKVWRVGSSQPQAEMNIFRHRNPGTCGPLSTHMPMFYECEKGGWGWGGGRHRKSETDICHDPW